MSLITRLGIFGLGINLFYIFTYYSRPSGVCRYGRLL